MACPISHKLCERLVLSQSIIFDDDSNSLRINLPLSTYENGEKYCIVLGQNIPLETTISADVYFTIGGDATLIYPLLNPDCSNVQATQLSTRMRYSTKVVTNIGGGAFRLMGRVNCSNCSHMTNPAPSLPIPVDPPEPQPPGPGPEP